MIKNNKLSPQGEENVKNFNKMFNNLNPKHFDRFTYLMAEAVVRKVKLVGELTQKLNETKQNYDGLSPQGEDKLQDVKDKLQDVQTWCRERLYCNAVEPRMEWL